MVHLPSLRRSLYSRTQDHKVPAHGANVTTGITLAAFGGAVFPVSPTTGALVIILAAAINGYSAYHITKAYNEHSIGYT